MRRSYRTPTRRWNSAWPNARQRLEAEARHAEHFALLGRLATGVSHEIRNPLSAIFLHVDLLEEETRTPSPESAATVADTLMEIKT